MQSTATRTEPDRLRPDRSAIAVDGASVRIDETTELRWFFDGPLPAAIRTWFVSMGRLGLTEHRIDTYRLDDQVDVGVKRRFGSMLELKRRREPPRSFTISNGSHGQMERWTRWSPADAYVEQYEDERWVDVEKDLAKRRFDAHGQEVSISETTRDSVVRGCDVEIVDITLDGRPSWSVAFSAFGPFGAHPNLLRFAGLALFGDGNDSWKKQLDSGLSCGYPEWLIRSQFG